MLSFQGFKQDKPLNEQIEELMDHLDYEHDSEDEGIEDYSIGGYHPVHIKGVLLNRYVVMQKGWFFYCMVGLRFSTYFCGFKIQKSASQYLEAAYDENCIQVSLDSITQRILCRCLDYHMFIKNKEELHSTEMILTKFIY